MGIGLDEVRQAVEIILDHVDASERAKSATPERAQLDAVVYRQALALLAHIAGPAIGRVLERDRDGAELDQPVTGAPDAKNSRWKDRAAVNRVLARLLYDLAPALGSFPALPVAQDLLGAIDGDSPLALVEPSRSRGQKDGVGIWTQARKRLALAIYFEAGRSGRTLEQVHRDIAAQEIDKDTMERIKSAVPLERRQAIRDAGKQALHTPDADRASGDLSDAPFMARLIKEATRYTRTK